MWKIIKDLKNYFKSEKITVKNLEEMPELHLKQIEFEFEGEIYAAEKMNLTIAQHSNGIISPLNKVSDEYELVQHHEALKRTVESIIKTAPEFGTPEIELSFSKQGGKMWANMTFPELVQIEKDDPVKPRVILVNSADLSKRFSVQFGAFRMVCSNGMIVPDSRFPDSTLIRNLHKKGSLDMDDAISKMMVGFESFSDTFDVWKEYAKLPIKEQEILDILESGGFTEKQSEKILAQPLRGFENTTLASQLVGDREVNSWIAYNAVTQFITDNNVNEGTTIDRGRKTSEGFDRLLKKAA